MIDSERYEYKEKHKKECLDIGQTDVEDFISVIKLFDPNVRGKVATFNEDTKHHIDIKLKYGIFSTPNREYTSIDLKGMKKVNRTFDKSSELFWVEIANNSGVIGWLDGKADYICFQMHTKYLMVSREELKKLTLKLTKNATVHHANYVCDDEQDVKLIHNLYWRGKWGHKDRTTLLTIDDLMSIKDKIIIPIPENISKFFEEKRKMRKY